MLDLKNQQKSESYLKMKINIKYISAFLMVVMLIANVWYCVKINNLGEEIKEAENETQKLTLVNQDLERKLFTLSSRQNLKETAKYLGFVKEAEPINLDSFKYALAK